MVITEHLEYSKSLDLIEGYEDLGHLKKTGRTSKRALVFMARGEYSSSTVIGYFFFNFGASTTSEGNSAYISPVWTRHNTDCV